MLDNSRATLILTSCNINQRQNFKGNSIKIQAQLGSLADAQADIIVLNLFRGTRTYGGATGAINDTLGGSLGRTIEKNRFMGEFGETMTIPTEGKIKAPKILLVGLGKQKFCGLSSIEKISAQVIKKCESIPGIKTIATLLHGAGCGGMSPKDCAKVLTKGASSVQDAKQIESLDIVEINSNLMSQINAGIKEAL